MTRARTAVVGAASAVDKLSPVGTQERRLCPRRVACTAPLQGRPVKPNGSFDTSKKTERHWGRVQTRLEGVDTYEVIVIEGSDALHVHLKRETDG